MSLSACLLALSAAGPSAGAGKPDSTRSEIERELVKAGLENVSVTSGDTLTLAYENRRYRHSAEALGIAHRAAGTEALVQERRLGMVAAAIATTTDTGTAPPRFGVAYPSDFDFPPPPAGPLRSGTFRHADLDVGPLVDYRIGQLFNPLQLRVEIQPRLRLNPWPGAALQLGVLIPLLDDYPASESDIDADRVRPGRMSIDQFAWLPRAALVSVSGGYFGDHRWGVSLGAARPLAQGSWLLDTQVERTGYIAFADSGTYFSNPRATSGYVGVTYRPGYSDVAVRARAAQFLYGDRGLELEVRRSLGDFDLAYFIQHSAGTSTFGIRLDLPVPPMRRAAGLPLRVQPVPRFALSFRDRSEPSGTWVSGVASREDYLRQLNRPALEANSIRYRERGGGPPPADTWVSLTGMTGFIQTPWAGVMPDRGFEAGYNFVPRRWANDYRGRFDNEAYYTTLGFLPRVETSVRWTRITGHRAFEEIAPDTRLDDIDRMSSGRIEFLHPRPGRPGLAAGVEDVQGTRRFHSSYVVAGIPETIFLVRSRLSLGYGFRVLKAHRYVLDGAFGAVDLVPTRFVRILLEYDSEKCNAALGLCPGAGLQLRAVLLNLDRLSFGAGWSHSL